MAFCTKCGANVSGAFCSQCGTPASAAAPAQPAASGAMQPARKTSPVVWILVIVLGFFMVCFIAVVGVFGVVAHRVHQSGVSFNSGRDGGFAIRARGADGKDARIDIGSTTASLPSWVPVYPGSETHGTFSVKGGDAEGGTFSFTTSDDAARVKSFYDDKIKDLGMKVELDSNTSGGGTVIAADEGGRHRSLTITFEHRSGGTTVTLIYGSK